MQRLDILHESHVIDEQTHQLVGRVISYLQEVQALDIGKMEVFITHLAMAVMRMKKGESIDGVDAGILVDIEKSEYHGKALQIIAEIESWSGFSYAQSEVSYLLLHLVNLFNEKGEK